MRLIIFTIGLILLGSFVYKFWPTKTGQQTTADAEITLLNELFEYPALETVLHHQEETKLEAAALDPRQFEKNPEEIRALIEKIETDLKDSDVLERLNNGRVGNEERNKIGDRLKVLDRLREQELAQHIFAIEQEVAALELNHGKRLRDYGVVQ